MTNRNDNVNYKPMFLLSAMFMGIIGSGFMSKEEAPLHSAPSIFQQKQALKYYVEDPIEIVAGDITSIHKIASIILKDEVSAMITPELKSAEGLTSVYQIGDYELTIENFDLKKSKEQDIFVSVRKVAVGATAKEDLLVLTSMHDTQESGTKANEVVSTYKLKVAVSDTTAPVISVVLDEDVITEGDDFDAEDYFESAIDDVDGEIAHETESDVDNYTPGVYTVTYRAKDNAGNESSASVTITVEEKEEPVQSFDYSSYYGGYYGNLSGVSSSAIASAALAQVGLSQDCTVLASNALAAAGVSYHGWPAGYMSLGSIVSGAEAQPGDLIYYADGGMGMSHIAVYIGGGQAVHGGWNGSSTVVAGAYIGSGPVFIRVGQ